MLTKVTIERTQNAELDDHLIYEKYEITPVKNSHNDSTDKTLTTEDGHIQLNIARDREGSFEPKIVMKNQTRLTSMDDKF